MVLRLPAGLFNTSGQEEVEKTNIVWFIAEDITLLLSPYGDSTAYTPNINRLSNEGVTYTNCYSVSGVCAPSRSALITGMYPTSIGTHNMRVNWNTPDDLGDYWVTLPASVKTFTQYMRLGGYFCTNNAKTDYNFNTGYADWDVNGETAHWRNRKNIDQPFFSVFTSNTTHESRIWQNSHLPMTVNPKDVPVPPYYPDNPVVRKDIARTYSNIELMDKELGLILDQLEEDQLLKNTIVVFIGDNGGPLPRQKRELYQSGINVPMIIRFPNEHKAGTISHDLISFVDFGPTMLKVADVNIPDNFHGIPFLPERKQSRKYIFAGKDRLDNYYDMVRAVSDGRYKYIRNFMPDKAYYFDIKYRLQMDMMQELCELHDNEMLSMEQARFFDDQKPLEELYDTNNDPHELINLANNEAYAEKLQEFRQVLYNWQIKYGDYGFVEEKNLRKYFWAGDEQPITDKPTVTIEGSKVELKCDNQNATMVYSFTQNDVESGDTYNIYSKPIIIGESGILKCRSERYGFKPSEWVVVDINQHMQAKNH